MVENKPTLPIEEIRFISTFEHFDDEASGIKPYTVRELIVMPGAKYDKIMKYLRGEINLMIIISRGFTKKRIANLCTHALQWKGDVILAWNPNEGMHDV